MTRTFPVLKPFRSPGVPGAPSSLPWSVVEPHRERARLNHGQTLERLAERGGLSWSELLALVTDRPVSKIDEWTAYRGVMVSTGLVP